MESPTIAVLIFFSLSKLFYRNSSFCPFISFHNRPWICCFEKLGLNFFFGGSSTKFAYGTPTRFGSIIKVVGAEGKESKTILSMESVLNAQV